jgi:hypothetical protein
MLERLCRGAPGSWQGAQNSRHRTCLVRVIRRRFGRGGQRADMPYGWKERLSLSLLRTVITFRRTEAPRVRRLLRGRESVVVLRDARQVRTYLASLGQRGTGSVA